MKKIIAATALTTALAFSGAAFAQSGGDAGTANKRVGAASSAPSNQSGTTDSATTGASAMSPGTSTGVPMKKHQAEKKMEKTEKMKQAN